MRQSAKETTVLRSQNGLLALDYHESLANTSLREPLCSAGAFGLHAEQAKLFPRKTVR